MPKVSIEKLKAIAAELLIGAGAPEAQVKVSILFPDTVQREAVHRRSGIVPSADAALPSAIGTPSRTCSLYPCLTFGGHSALFPL